MADYSCLTDKELQEQIRMIGTDVRLDIGMRLNCAHCSDLRVSAMRLAALSPRITVHVLDLDRLSRANCSCGGFRVPFVMVNKRYIFFGKRSPRQLIWMIAEAIAGEQPS